MAVYKDKTNRWRFRKQLRIDNRVISLSGTPPVNTKAAAEAMERKKIDEALKEPPPIPKEVPTFDEFATTFMATYAKTNNKPSEVESKRSILDNHLRPAFGPLKLDAINAQHIEELKARLLERKTSRKYINNVLNVVRKLLHYALELELVERMPTIKALKLAPGKFEFLDFEDFERLVAAAELDPEWQAAILLAGSAGLRLGEVLGLHWDDIDRDGVLTVRHNDWRGQLGTPKGGRERSIPLTKRTLDAVKALRHLLLQRVFCYGDGRPWTLATMREGLKRQEKRAGLTAKGKWHRLRHTFCSHLAMRGAAAIEIKELAGHQSIATTNRYVHLAPERRRTAMALLEAPLQRNYKTSSGRT